jgi:hypothetical protein
MGAVFNAPVIMDQYRSHPQAIAHAGALPPLEHSRAAVALQALGVNHVPVDYKERIRLIMAGVLAGQRRWFVAILLAVPTIAMIVAILFAKKRMESPVSIPPPPIDQQHLMNEWKNQPFIDLQNGIKADEIVKGIRFTFNERLDDIQRAALTNAVINFVAAYKVGTFDSITKWRIPAASFYFSASVSNAMVNRYSIPAATVRDRPLEAWHAWWSATYKDWFTNFWTSISVTSCWVDVSKSMASSNDLETDLTRLKSGNVGWVKLFPGILFDQSPDRIFAANNSITLATIQLLVNQRGDPLPFPIYLRLYWSPEDNEWLPQSLVEAYARPDRLGNLFF